MNEQSESPEQTSQLPREGEKIGAGVVKSILGAGGFAHVFKTWVEDLETHRAVKVMSPSAEQIIRDRFATEARISSKLIHQNIVPVHNYGQTAAGLPYIEMEFIDGPTLEEVIERRGALPLPVALAAGCGLLDALHYAHNVSYTLYKQPHKGVMHRDIKPANIMFSGGVPKLMDFGIARPVVTSLHTKRGDINGTWAYMAPELYMDGEGDFRSDIYQVGLLLYECITGVIAYPQTKFKPLIAAITTGDHKPPDTHKKAAAIIKKCMEIDPEKRYQTAQECLTDIRALYQAQSPKTTPEENLFNFIMGDDNAESTNCRDTACRVRRPLTLNSPPTEGWRKAPGWSISPRPHRPRLIKPITTAAACILITALIGVGAVRSAPAVLRTILDRADAFTAPAAAAPTVESPIIMTAPAESKQPTPKKPAPSTTASASNVETRRAVSADTATLQPHQTPTDALFFIEQGKKLLAANNPQEALKNFQTAIRTPSTAPKQEIIKQSLYGSAKCNTILYGDNKIPRTNFEISWQNVQNAYASGTPEHTESQTHLIKGHDP